MSRNRAGRQVRLAAVLLMVASCNAPAVDAPPAPMDGIYTAVSIDDSAGPVRLTGDPLLDLAISGASLDLRVPGRAILTTTLMHPSDSTLPPVTFIHVFLYRVIGDSIATDSMSIGGRRLAYHLRFTDRYEVPEPVGYLDEIAFHTFIFHQ